MFKNRKGMTVVEMIAVVAITAILASLLVNGILKARQKLQSAVCMSNLKQLMQTVHMYISEDRLGRFPGWAGSFDNFKELMPLLYPYLSGETTITKEDNRLDVFECHSNTNNQWASNRIDAFGNQTDYEYNGNLISQVATQTVAVPEWVAVLYDWPIDPALPYDPIHNGGSNIVFYDTHVQWFSRTQMMEPHAPTGSTRAYDTWGIF